MFYRFISALIGDQVIIAYVELHINKLLHIKYKKYKNI